MTKKMKKAKKCEACGEVRELQAAHKTGMGRKDIIKKVLSSDYIGDGPMVKIDLERVKKEIIEAHMPLDQMFQVLVRRMS